MHMIYPPDEESSDVFSQAGKHAASNRLPVTEAQYRVGARSQSQKMKVLRSWWQHWRNKWGTK